MESLIIDLMEALRDDMVAIATTKVGTEAAEDIVQDTAIAAWEAAATVSLSCRDEETCKKWMWGIFHQKVKEYLRAASRVRGRIAGYDAVSSEELIDAWERHEQECEDADRKRAFEARLARTTLTAAQQAVLCVLQAQEGPVNLAAAARNLGVRKQTVQDHLAAIEKKLLSVPENLDFDSEAFFREASKINTYHKPTALGERLFREKMAAWEEWEKRMVAKYQKRKKK